MQIIYIDIIVVQVMLLGCGGVGIVCVFGFKVFDVVKVLLNVEFMLCVVIYIGFYDVNQEVIDQGIVLYFKVLNFFIGEDVVEFQGYGGLVIMDMLLEVILKIKLVRLVCFGEFSE